ncbi:C-type lectin domain family 4 member K-like isoform X1 [Crotalus tigris]|uniref:C-type lectin domain family 4 member K-like isoform X1 n=1 Tax=Crotalus tigris TaxID=88082 RepID=UPI00192F159F|nr:C-type lectin domain family 4 member K-like isoform X1 [Crotalus tigris]XP_039224765.1 C-type lectin domain family 4 member K-like isoform X1 [Crotalus tigris]XP_039224766.1 C-type lectin domain family 4 member K-like isoform X1 [Crotalus tigris]XP_039224768.1 C-type lectin domain family 4 member K-like isoform X1 [Crotalus tigris]XP_039224769.1 C-type lectin domain family 4 member K-like isoform X1 [Crotalus tigris]
MAPRAPPKVAKAPITGAHRLVVVGFVILFCLLLCTSWIGALCLMEKLKHDALRKAVAGIRSYMVSVDANYNLLNDTDLILEAEKLTVPLAVLSIKHQELEGALEDLQGKLSKDWIIYRGKIYYFGDQMLQQEKWVNRCISLRAEIVSVRDRDEQEFLGTLVASRYGSFWIGYRYHAKENKFVWHNPEVPAYPTYWVDGFPQLPEDNQCVLMSSRCPTLYKCWINYPCEEPQKGICKKSPELRWMS